MNLIIFTQTYPSATSPEQTFMGRELPYLIKYFNQIILVPQKEAKTALPLPENVTVDNSFAQYYKQQGYLGIVFNALISRYFYKELFQRGFTFISPKMFIRLIKFMGDAEITRRWFEPWVENEDINVDKTLFYSFWFTQITTGIVFSKQKHPDLKIVSRAHGYDVYEEDYHPWPYRCQSLRLLNKLFFASYGAYQYMCKKYPQFSGLYETSHLGVEDPRFLTKKSTDETLRIVSCSSIIPLKRVELIAQSINLAVQIRPTQKIQWLHFGDGRGYNQVQRIIAKFHPNAEGKLQGQTPNTKIMTHYKENPVDIFINLSTTEGGSPVSIQEAISCGIPIIATNVGGNPEIVSEENGILLDKTPMPKEIAQAILKINDNPEIANKMRIASRKKWEENFNAKTNFQNFAKQLQEITRN